LDNNELWRKKKAEKKIKKMTNKWVEIKTAFKDKEITPFGGLMFMKQILEKIGIKEMLENIRA
jgi:ABC-type Fe3+-hydroxamate transport system substrate-binding protein